MYRFLDDPAPGPHMDYRVECVQVLVDPKNALSGSPAMVGGYMGGGLELMRINDTTSSVPTYLCGAHRLEAADLRRWKEDFGSGPENVSGGFVLLQGRVEEGQPRFELVPPEPGDVDYLDSYGMVVVPKPGNDDIIFKARWEDHFEVLYVPATNEAYNIGQAEVLLDSSQIVPSQTWNPYFYSPCFLGLVPNEQVSGGLDLIVSLSLEDASGADHQRHGYICVTGEVYLSTHVSPRGSGAVLRNPDQTWYPLGTPVELTAVPDGLCEFDQWTGDVPAGHETDNPLTVTMDGYKSVTAHFAMPLGDVDRDCDLDLPDFAGLQRCFGESPVSDACAAFDFDGDDDVDMDDFDAWAQTMTGPNE
ncbi:MAG: hypothetical protein KAY37_16180 [Phycisphaerae bacterium]|nr:hypothetical protein [Phycisphaerae bacterium]